MESFESVLAVGGRTNSLGRAEEVIDAVGADPARLDELFDCVFADDAWVRMRAIDSFEKVVRDDPARVQRYIDRIFDDLTAGSQPSIQWHLAQLFPQVGLTQQQQADAVAWLQRRLETTEVDWIVSVNAMKALLHFHQEGVVEARKVQPLLEVQEQHHSKSVRKKARALQQQLGQREA